MLDRKRKTCISKCKRQEVGNNFSNYDSYKSANSKKKDKNKKEGNLLGGFSKARRIKQKQNVLCQTQKKIKTWPTQCQALKR